MNDIVRMKPALMSFEWLSAHVDEYRLLYACIHVNELCIITIYTIQHCTALYSTIYARVHHV